MTAKKDAAREIKIGLTTIRIVDKYAAKTAEQEKAVLREAARIVDYGCMARAVIAGNG